MRVLFFLCSIVLCNCLFSQENTSSVEWTNEYNLSWDDFQGEEIVDLSLSALSKIAIPYNYTTDGEVDLSVKLTTNFIKDESWYKKGEENKVLLGHEQLHFDIAEIHRRLMVKAILNAKISADNYESELKTIINNIWEGDYRKMQDQYDAETNYARMFRAQVDWNKLIADKLIELQEYNHTEITITFE